MRLTADLVSSEEDLFLRRRMKVELRKRMRGVRGALPPAARGAKSGLIIARLLALAPVAQARTVALFWPMEDRREVDLRPLDGQLRARGARIAYPASDPDTGGMTFRFVFDPQAMCASVLGTHEPAIDAPEAAPGEIDVIVVPALAVDPRGHRIGYGGGYYDRALPRFSPPATTVVVAFEFQLVVELPNMPGDVACGWIATDAHLLQAE